MRACNTTCRRIVTMCCRSPPNIYFKKKKTGGVSVNSTLQLTKMDDKLIQRVLQEYKIHNCEVRRRLGGQLQFWVWCNNGCVWGVCVYVD